MRFENFVLDGLPEEGLIGIFGENESGKSTVGELICYCLFGRSTQAEEGEPDRILRWGQDSCTVEMNVEIGGEDYYITRKVSRDGSAEGRMEAALSGEVIASTVAEIEDVVSGLLGYGFKEFRYSTFIAQNELDIILRGGEDRRLVLNNMLGVGFMEKMAAKAAGKREDREKEVQSVRKRLDDKKEVLQVYQARERDMDRVLRRLDRESGQMLAAIKERDSVQSTITLLEEVRRKAELMDVIDKRIKSRRAQIQEMEEKCGILLKDSEKLPELKSSLDKKNAEINEIQEDCLRELHEKYGRIDKYREFKRKHSQLMTQVDLKEAAASEMKDRLENIDRMEGELEQRKKEENSLIHYVESPSPEDKLKTEVFHLVKDVELLASEIEKEKVAHSKDLQMVIEREKAFASQQDRINRQIESVSVQDVDRQRLQKVQTAERSASLVRDICLGLAALFMMGGFIVTLITGNVNFLVILSGMAPSLAAWVVFQSRARSLDQTQQQLQQQLYAFNIAQRGILELQESTDEVDRHLKDLKKDIEKEKEIGMVFDHISINTFEDIDRAVARLEENGPKQLDRALNMMVDILKNHGHLRRLIGDDSKSFSSIRDMNIKNLVDEKKAYHSWLRDEIERLEKEIARKEEFREQLRQLESALANLKGLAGELQGEMNALGVTDDDLPELKKEEEKINTEISGLKTETGDIKAEISKIEAQAEEAHRLEERRKEIVGEIDDDLIKYYELREATYEMDYSDERFDQLNTKFEDLEQRVLESRLAIKEIEAERKTVQKDLDRVPVVSREVENLEREISDREETIRKFADLEKIFLRTGENIRERMIPQIETYFGWVLPRMTRGRYRRVRLDDNFNIKVFSEEYGDFVDLKVLSGGTADQLLISLRLAFARATFAHTSTASQFLFLDEPFSSFDDSRRTQFFELLRSLKSSFQQIFLISHLTNLEDFVDYFFRLDLKSAELPSTASWMRL